MLGFVLLTLAVVALILVEAELQRRATERRMEREFSARIERAREETQRFQMMADALQRRRSTIYGPDPEERHERRGHERLGRRGHPITGDECAATKADQRHQ